MDLRRLLVASVCGCFSLLPAASGQSVTKPPEKSGTSLIPDTTIAINSPTPLSQRVVAYTIDAKYDPATHSLDASEVLTYHNLTGQPLDHFPFHLYLNAFQAKATFMREAKAYGTRDVTFEKWKPEYWGADEIRSFEVIGMGDLTSKLQFIQPDDGNPEDKTVVEVALSKPVLPGEFVQFK